MSPKICWLLLPIVASLASGSSASAQTAAPRPAEGAQAVDLGALQAEVERLRSIVPGQALAMTQVAYNFSNLWFAAHEENWPLAQFYVNETRVRLRWAVRITPTRKIASGEVALAPILDGLEKDQLSAVERAVASRNVAQLEASYRSMLEGCYGCHVASEKPFLRLQVPEAPAEPLIDFEAR